MASHIHLVACLKSCRLYLAIGIKSITVLFMCVYFKVSAGTRVGCICLMSSADLLLVVCQLQQLGKSCLGTGSLHDIFHSIYSLYDMVHSMYSCSPIV